MYNEKSGSFISILPDQGIDFVAVERGVEIPHPGSRTAMPIVRERIIRNPTGVEQTLRELAHVDQVLQERQGSGADHNLFVFHIPILLRNRGHVHCQSRNIVSKMLGEAKFYYNTRPQ